MKKLILAPEATTADIEDNNFIGVKWKNEGKAIIVQGSPGGFTSMGKSLDISNKWKTESKRDYAEEAMRMNNGAEVYKFETFQEMLDWWK